MDTKEQAQAVQASPPPTSRTRRFHVPSVLFLAAGLAVGSAAFVVYSLSGPDPTPEKKPPTGAAWNYEELFPNWPKDRKPDFVIVVTGQTYGYLQKCGCSDPQKGGLERRFNFLEGFKVQGIEAVPIDLGDVAPQVAEDHKILHPQALLKYGVAMRCMKAMGYRVVGLGREEFALGLLEALGEYSLQGGNERPRILAANLLGVASENERKKPIVLPKNLAFPNGDGTGQLIHDWDIITTKSKINLGVVGTISKPVIQDVKKIDDKIVFAEAPATEKIIKTALHDMEKTKDKPALNILLFSGPIDLAKNAAEIFPKFQVIVCSSEESEPPNAPTMLVDPKKDLNSMLVRVGHKGQNIGVIGVFKKEKGGYDLRYQRVALTPEFETPKGQEKNNIALQELERYAKLVKDRGYLAMNRKVMHPLQVVNPNATYAGSQSCLACHTPPVAKAGDNSATIWAASKHAGAYNALATIATRPSLRQFDGECIRCHTVGYDYNTGFVDALKTPNLMNVGCESCHGPGSQHAANPRNKALALELSPWKIEGQGSMPDPAQLKGLLEETDPAKRQKIATPMQTQIMLRVDRTCQTCHNAENDPHFKIEEFWPKIAHGKLAAKANAPKENVPEDKNSGPALTPSPDLPLQLPLPK